MSGEDKNPIFPDTSNLKFQEKLPRSKKRPLQNIVGIMTVNSKCTDTEAVKVDLISNRKPRVMARISKL